MVARRDVHIQGACSMNDVHDQKSIVPTNTISNPNSHKRLRRVLTNEVGGPDDFIVGCNEIFDLSFEIIFTINISFVFFLCF
ncbi:MAG: hypothetical protein MASP_01948 [Candidatus Methanolliviera sp. GoM_asphalt]|nr:MAG: hypothetical protein MASP_01948 [Candidatus Methanolliviera sp. GoM_asphalt]